MDSLESYRAKRNFKRTPEPSGKSKPGKPKSAGGVFVVHKHDARRLHYDLRLEHDGVLWSWAVTRGPSLDPSDKRLAVHVEDHPFEYRTFEGIIPEGYGAGTVVLWDEGSWTPEFDPAWGMKKGHIRFELDGQKLHGLWDLVRLKRKAGEKRDNWLLIKADDAFARPGEDILLEQPRSVKSGRTVEEVAAGKPPRRKPIAKALQVTKPKARKSSKPMPGFIEPQLATLRSNPPSGDEWLHEVKFDGYRIQAHVSQGKVTLFTRKGLDWTAKFGSAIPEALAALDCEDAVIDGEIVVLSDQGVASFSALQAALSSGRTDLMLYYAFDLLHLDGVDLRGEPLLERKAKLHRLVGTGLAHAPVHYSEHFETAGQTMLAHACRMGLEGIISKRADAPYEAGRSLGWIKSKCTLRQEFVILGYVPSEATGRGLRSLVVGYHRDGKLHYGGRVGTGFSGTVTNDLKKRLDRIRTKRPPVGGEPAKDRKVVWAKPDLVAEVEFRSWTDDGILRQASFQGLREDKPASEVVAETGMAANDGAAADITKARSPRASKEISKRPKAMSVTLSSPEKLLWPEAGISKQGLLEHYEKVWPRIEQFIVDRPLSLVRAPDGIDGQRFFQKHASKGMHEAIIRTADPEDGEELLSIRDFDGLAALVQFGVVEIHIWGSTLAAIEMPDQIVFDLDPDEGLGVEDVRAATLDVKDRLDALGLPSFVKTSGGKGFHVVVPLKPKADWDTVKTFSHDFARAMEQTDPGRYTSVLSKKARKGRVFVDYLRNGRGSTAVAPWSSRAKPNATVAVPVTFDMVRDGVGPADFSIGSKALDDALKRPDPWADFFKAAKPLKL
ncbi:DNA ligase D [Mesorhizobium sp. KR9-304]|uniref:DNA ligase D n=1 Tax=Mesorhizobium sp. KR9-304 TaxID=3156614 RepID=UPI0032B55ABE